MRIASLEMVALVAVVVGLRAVDAPSAVGSSDTIVGSTAKAAHSFRTRPDLRPPKITVDTNLGSTAPGLIFVGPKKPPAQVGPMIVDDRGETVWFRPLTGRALATDLRVQRYRGRPVLTWWQGRTSRGWGHGVYVIADSSYQRIARVKAGGSLSADLHDMTITKRGTALVTIYRPVKRNLRSVGGVKRGTVMDSMVREIDIASGRILHEWHSIRHVGLRESYDDVPKNRKPFDYFHINSVDVANDGNLLVSARNTHAVYKVNRRTGRVIWRLGGKRSSFRMGSGTRFAWQHDARSRPDGTITIFDNSAVPPVREESRGITLRLDLKSKRATLVQAYKHPRGLLVATKANMQTLPNGNVFFGWGSRPFFSEFGENGELLFDARFTANNDTYRAYRFPWRGRPPRRPDAKAGSRRDGKLLVYASWNGATEVASWTVLAGGRRDQLRPLRSAARTGFETAIAAQTDEPFIAVRALDAAGKVLGTSKAVEPRKRRAR